MFICLIWELKGNLRENLRENYLSLTTDTFAAHNYPDFAIFIQHDYMQFRITTGLFTPSDIKKHKKAKQQSISNTDMALVYILSCAILCVSFLATSQPSDHFHSNSVSYLGKYTSSIAHNCSRSTYAILYGDLTSPSEIEKISIFVYEPVKSNQPRSIYLYHSDWSLHITNSNIA